MELREVIFQGVWGRDKAARLAVDEGLTTIQTPPGVSHEQVVDLLVALLYPDSEDGRRPEWLTETAGKVRLGAIVTHSGQTYRLLRAASPKSLRLQRETQQGYDLAAKGLESVTGVLDNRLARPSLGECLALNFWALGRASRQLTMRVSESHQFSRAERRTLEAYRRATRADQLEDELEELKSQQAELRDKWGEVLEREQELQKAQRELQGLESDRLPDDQIELLRHRESREERLHRKLEELEGRESSTRRAIESTEPTPPWRDQTFWAGIGVALTAVGVGIWLEESHRWIMLLDAVGFGVALFVGLRYLTRLERQGVHEVRLDSTRRRTRELRQELVDFQERIDHILTHAEAEDAQTLIEKNERANKLEAMIREMERELEEVRQDPGYRQDRDRLEELRRSIEMKSEELDDLKGATPPVFELENQLHDMGINPKAGLERLEAHRSGSSGPQTSEIEVLQRICQELGLMEDGELSEGGLLEMWQKICGHILGEPFDTVCIKESELRVSGTSDSVETLAPPESTRRRQINCALAFAAHASTANRSPGIRSIWIPHPEAFGGGVNVKGWQQVLKQARGTFDVALLQ